MKLRNLLLVFVLILSLSVSAVYAQETATEAAPAEEAAPAQEESSGGFLKSLFGEGGMLADVLPAGTDVDALLSTAGEQLSQAESELGTVFSSVIEKAKSEGIDFSADSLKDQAMSLLSQMTGDFDFGAGLDGYMDTIDAIRKTVEAYYKDHNADLMDPAEVQVLSSCILSMDGYPEAADYLTKETRGMSYVTQLNFTVNEASQLVFVSGASDVIEYTVQPDEAGNFSVVSAKFAEDGVNYKPSIEAMMAEVEAADPIEEIMNEIEFGRVSVPFDLEQFLDEHPEYTAAEYGGEMHTREELHTMWLDDLSVMFDEPAEEPAPAN